MGANISEDKEREIFCIITNRFEKYSNCYNCKKFNKEENKCSLIKNTDFIPKERECKFKHLCHKYKKYDMSLNDITLLPDMGKTCEEQCWKCLIWHGYNFKINNIMLLEEFILLIDTYEDKDLRKGLVRVKEELEKIIK